ncbi:hypothetical protein [Cryptosporangium aurantiacum]|uniref:Uncharacterized protein n=1 Tax=Cryptosporangium aurantiacum TaxID=134849 RepID=A0A1M7RPZ5_9ACTN|nr:hypothetical protein [Cryptosporangium aurantiacum]SHN48152.1 hypothetical protein SAMN05443668_1353 [Cryptosporangium aurantiacum]
MTETATRAPLGGSRWNAFPPVTAMTAHQFFAGTAPLLQFVLDSLESIDRDVLAAQIHATLGLGTRETSLPLAAGPDAAPAAREFAAQADTIGREIAAWTGAALDRLLADRTPFPAGPLVVRSHCDGHLLTHPATDLLMGRRGGPVTIQLYNEWLHQMVLLRDALLPFVNWQDVPLRVTPTGLRHVEESRERFLAEVLFRQVRHTSVVRFARSVVTGAGGPDGYGFDTDGGTVLPAVVGASPLTAAKYLLRWAATAPGGEPATYINEIDDYYTAPRTLIETLPGPGAAHALRGRVVAGPVREGIRTARVEVTRGTASASVDLGQALRGHRFASRQGPAAGGDAGPIRPVDGWAVLSADGLAWTEDGDVLVDASGQDDLVVLAVLGTLYPENVVLRRASSDSRQVPSRPEPVTAGKDDPNRVVVDVDQR